MTEQIESAPQSAAAVTAPAPVEPVLVPGVDPRVDPRVDPASRRAQRERRQRARAAHEAKLSRLRLYSYCLTLLSCVLALMSFMYLAQGTADGDSTFTWLGVAFVASTVGTLWCAIRVTQSGDFAA
jgi:hypothetical protein